MKKQILFLIVLLCTVLSVSSALADSREAEYLSVYFGVSFSEVVTPAEFSAALVAMGGAPYEAETLTLSDAVAAAVRYAGMEELALTYIGDADPQKAAEVLADEDVVADESAAPYIACALDLDLIDDDEDFSGPLSGEIAAELLYKSAEISGKGRRYLGRLSDDGILSAVAGAFASDFIFDDEKLNEAGLDILISGAATGYSLKYSGYDAHFLEDYTLRYGHDGQTHLLQLIGLLISEGYDAYVQIEPKVSVYEYMLEWGEPSAPSPTYMVTEVTEGRYFAFAMEYELVLEFDSAEEKEDFHGLIEDYAKKYDDRVDENGNITARLLAGSWW